MSTLYEKCAAKFSREELKLLEKAILLAQKAHETQKRESGEDYFIHPDTVAIMLYDMGIDRHCGSAS